MLRQYCFCPRIPYFYLVRALQPYEQLWVKQGVDEHERQQMLMNRRNLSRFDIKSDGVIKNTVELYGEKLNLHGICDAVLETSSEVAILEFKNTSNNKVTAGTAVQLTAYAMLYEEQFHKPVRRGFVLYGTKAKSIEIVFNPELRQKTINIKNCILEIIKHAYIPDSSADEKKCGQCEFINFCADRF